MTAKQNPDALRNRRSAVEILPPTPPVAEFHMNSPVGSGSEIAA
jgi:hypothetical protein